MGSGSLIELEVRAVLTPEPRLHVTLTNRSDESLVTYEHALPWRNAYSMIVVAAEADPSGATLERTLPIDDPGPGTTSLAPEETVSGEILLVERFRGFPAALAKRDVITFWAYRFQAVGAAPLPWLAGHVVFPATTSGDRAADSSG